MVSDGNEGGREDVDIEESVFFFFFFKKVLCFLKKKKKKNWKIWGGIGGFLERKEERKKRTDLCRSSRLSFRHRRWMMVRVEELQARGLRLLRVRP